MECRECGKDITNAEHKMVAEWPFCLECFQRLLEKPKKPEPEPEPEPEPAPEAEPPEAPSAGPGISFQVSARTAAAEEPSEAPSEGPRVSFQVGARTAPPPAEATEQCALCNGPASEGSLRLGPMILCSQCAESMGHTPTPVREPVRDAVPESHGVQTAAPAPEVEKKAFINCAGCGRRVPEGGSKPVGDEHYCPDCHAALPPEVTAAQPAEPAPEPAKAPPAAHAAAAPDRPGLLPGSAAQAGDRCESCDRPQPAAALEVLEGFHLCSACVSTDAALALKVARARHQRRLQRLQGELD